MIKAGLIGLGKMGISHCSILGAHPDVDLCAVCDTSRLNLVAFEKYSPFRCFSDYREMIKTCNPDCLFIATPTRFHAEAALYAMDRGIHLFVEKPLCVDSREAVELASEAEACGVVNQVGFHNRFVGTFREAKRLLSQGLMGELYHFLGEAYGPVVLKAKGETWRSKKSEGGGCLYDYASHVIDLISFYFGEPKKVSGTTIKKIFSAGVDDAVYSTLIYDNGLSGQLSVNWSEETHRKMTTRITVWGKEGKLLVDAHEMKIYLKKDRPEHNLQKGWNIRYITDLTEPVPFYLRGEEYSAQVNYFIKRVKEARPEGNINCFSSAIVTNKVIDLLLHDSSSGGAGGDGPGQVTTKPRSESFFRKLLRR
ncbi:MAG: Gfo/Idh/MocA family oxidoreductase [Deltaproteobacteria bacterium]|jgi:predicted dehydrogenase|nr:Gfo/Idh/MocA family oxidoreductase [Deltaproteobacteria bacterium]